MATYVHKLSSIQRILSFIVLPSNYEVPDLRKISQYFGVEDVSTSTSESENEQSDVDDEERKFQISDFHEWVKTSDKLTVSRDLSKPRK